MKQFLADSNYHQFYVADRALEPDAPTEWTDQDVAARHLTLENIAALCPGSDIDARITSCGPNDPEPSFPDSPDFELTTHIRVPSRRVGIYGWPWELEDEYEINSDTVIGLPSNLFYSTGIPVCILVLKKSINS
jgi:hypothetical protein